MVGSRPLAFRSAKIRRTQVAELELRGDAGLELRALDWLYTTWLPSSGFSPDHQPCFEAWIGRPFAHGTAHFELRLHLPVVCTSPE
jgi:AraC family transcriptional regulator